MTSYLTELFSIGALILLPSLLLIRNRLTLASRLQLAASLVVIATLGSLYYSEVANYFPCKFCWIQRVFMYSAAVIGVLAWIRRELILVRPYLIGLSAVGLCFSLYHIAIERWPQLEGSACKMSVPCASPYFQTYGFVTLAVMAAAVFAGVIVLLIGNGKSKTGVDNEEG